MTTIVDPSGSPQIILRDDTQIMLDATAAGSSGATATPVPISTSSTVVVVTNDSNAKGVRVVGAEIGDRVSFVRANGATDFYIYDESEAIIFTSGANSGAWAEIMLTHDGWRGRI